MVSLMKNLLCCFLCAMAGVALAVEPEVVAVVEVRAITSPNVNTVVAIPGLDLATRGALAISNLVKTTNLEVGDMLVAFSGSEFESWELQSVGGVKVWTKASGRYVVNGQGSLVEVSASGADTYTLPVGSGIWLSRKGTPRSTSLADTPFYVYAQQPDTTTMTIGSGTSLVGNPTQLSKAPSVTDPSEGDKISIPGTGLNAEYMYTNSVWKTKKGWSGWVQADLPAIPAGTGFWYVSKSGVTIVW